MKKAYRKGLNGMDARAVADTARAYGGVVRSGKGKLVETLAASMAEAAWISFLGQDPGRLKVSVKKTKIKVPLRKAYLSRPDISRATRRILAEKAVCPVDADVRVYVDDQLVLPIECKAYTEITMLKMILVNAMLMKRAVPTPYYALVQLESQLGGDFSDCPPNPAGSPSFHTLMSYFKVSLLVVTLLRGERKVTRPIHKFDKPLKSADVLQGIQQLSVALAPHARNPSLKKRRRAARVE
jgi:hypothetical protein